jgi:hypothetical protein
MVSVEISEEAAEADERPVSRGCSRFRTWEHRTSKASGARLGDIISVVGLRNDVMLVTL